MAEDLGERTEEPTPRRLNQSRQRGQVPKSQDLGSAIDLIGAAVLIVLLGGHLAATCAAMFHHLLGHGGFGHALSPDHVAPLVRWTAGHTFAMLAPFLLLMFVIVYIGQFIQVGWLLTLYPLQPKLTKLSPIRGVKRIFSRRSLVKTLVNTVKVAVVVAVVVVLIKVNYPRIAGMALLDLIPAVVLSGRMLLELAAWVLLLMLIIGLLDLIYQRWQHRQDNKMTKHEVKDERKSMEGDVTTKSRRLKMARQMALQRMQHAVPQADVVVTNPTHFAVALKYDAETMHAPQLIAKGADYMAFRLREIAAANSVPIVERPALARALYSGVEVGRFIPSEFYQAVAEILAYVYRLERKGAA